MVSKFTDFLIRLLVVFPLVLSIWLILINMISIHQGFLLLPVNLLVAICAAILIPKSFISKVLGYFKSNPKAVLTLLIGVAVVSVGLRFGFLAHEYQPTSDPEHFYTAAKDLAETGFLDKSYVPYVANYPYLYSYDFLLGKAMSIFGQGTLAVIVLNTLLDLLAAGLLYLLIRAITRNKNAALIGVLLWLLSPFNIIFSAISLPIIAVNTLIIAALLLVYLLLKNLNNLKLLVPLSIATGAVFSLTNAFRPFMVVFLIALVIYWLLYFLKNPKFKTMLNLDVALIGVLLPFFMLNYAYAQMVSVQTDLPPTLNSGGWSIYVGSNYEYAGRWNQEDSTYGTQVFIEEPTSAEAHSRLQKEGMQRYAALSTGELVDFGLKKTVSLGGDLYNMTYNMDTYPSLWDNLSFKWFVWIISALYVYTLLLLTAKFFIDEVRKKQVELNFMHYLFLVFFGLFIALLFVEVLNRYFTPFLVFMTIFASIALINWLPNLNKRVESAPESLTS